MMRRSAFRRECATSRQESEMAANNLHELQEVGNTGDPVERLRLLCLSRGANGILNVGRLFRRMDEDGHKKLNLDEFVEGLKEIGLKLSDEEAQDMFMMFDTDESGCLNMDEFFAHIRPHLSESRMKNINDAFQKMDKIGDGLITIDDLKHVYNVRAHPLYISGEISGDEILKKFLENFEQGARKDGMVTKEEFLNYYSALSASVDNDGYFDLMMRQAYKL